MSELKKIIEIAPNIFGKKYERLECTGFTCSACGGTGYVDVDPLHSPERELCGRCKGTGRMKAVVEITWVGDHKLIKS